MGRQICGSLPEGWIHFFRRHPIWVLNVIKGIGRISCKHLCAESTLKGHIPRFSPAGHSFRRVMIDQCDGPLFALSVYGGDGIGDGHRVHGRQGRSP